MIHLGSCKRSVPMALANIVGNERHQTKPHGGERESRMEATPDILPPPAIAAHVKPLCTLVVGNDSNGCESGVGV